MQVVKIVVERHEHRRVCWSRSCVQVGVLFRHETGGGFLLINSLLSASAELSGAGELLMRFACAGLHGIAEEHHEDNTIILQYR